MMYYFIGGSRDLSKVAVRGDQPERELTFYRPHSFGVNVIEIEHYHCLGPLPSTSVGPIEPTFVYTLTDISTRHPV